MDLRWSFASSELFWIALVILVTIPIYIYDLLLVMYVVSIRNQILDCFFIYLTIYGNYILAILEIVYLLRYYRDRTKLDQNIAIVSALVGWCVTSRAIITLKNIFRRPRPFMVCSRIEPICGRPTDYSFPSGHANAAWTLITPLISSVGSKKIRILLVIFAVLMCFSRVYCGVHYVSDVIWGGLIGFALSKRIHELFNMLLGGKYRSQTDSNQTLWKP